MIRARKRMDLAVDLVGPPNEPLDDYLLDVDIDGDRLAAAGAGDEDRTGE